MGKREKTRKTNNAGKDNNKWEKKIIIQMFCDNASHTRATKQNETF